MRTMRLVGVLAVLAISAMWLESLDARGFLSRCPRSCESPTAGGDVDAAFPPTGNMSVPGGGVFCAWGYAASNVTVKDVQFKGASCETGTLYTTKMTDSTKRWACVFKANPGTVGNITVTYDRLEGDGSTTTVTTTV